MYKRNNNIIFITYFMFIFFPRYKCKHLLGQDEEIKKLISRKQ